MKIGFQVVHQPAPLASARRAAMHQHDQGAGSGFEKVNLGRCQFTHPQFSSQRPSGSLRALRSRDGSIVFSAH